MIGSSPCSAPGEALETIGGLAGTRGRAPGARVERAGERPNDPGVDGDALGGGRRLDAGLERLRQAEGDPGAGVVTRERLGLDRSIVDEDELGLATGEPDLDVPVRENRGKPEGRVVDDVE